MIVITGPGRSGTSLLAKLYRELGFDPGGAWDTAIRAGYEEAATVAVNTELCRELRAPMGNPPDNPLGAQRWDLVGDLAQRYGARLRDIASAREVVKDPRFCWTLRVWLEAGAPIDHVVLTLRPVDEVIGSAERAGMVQRAGSADEQNVMRAVRMYRVGSVLSALGDADVPYTTVWFPRFLDDPGGLYDALVFPRAVGREEFLRIFERTVDRELVRFESP